MNSDALERTMHEFLKTKLEVLQKKVALHAGVEEVFVSDRRRIESDKNDLQILRAQLAAAQLVAVGEMGVDGYTYGQ
jgi:Tat protein secretion system quality control protein TatD with DNase activity